MLTNKWNCVPLPSTGPKPNTGAMHVTTNPAMLGQAPAALNCGISHLNHLWLDDYIWSLLIGVFLSVRCYERDMKS